MIKRAKNHATAAVVAALSVLAAPALAHAGSGGAGLLSPTAPFTSPGGPAVGDGNATVTASGAGITVSTTAAAVLSHQLTFVGAAPSGDSGDTVEIERLGHETDWTWTPTTDATVAPDGSFSATWLTNHIGQFSIRAIIETPAAQATSASAASPQLSVTIYLPTKATWYGPGFFGKRLACGGRLRAATIGVANRTLPCGTQVALLYHGHTLVVPVIDRGPYANGANWDLTEATGQALGMTGTATIGAASLPAEPAG